MWKFYKNPEESSKFLMVSMIRLAITFPLLYAFLHLTKIWTGFEDNVILVAILVFIYNIVVYYIKKRKENRLRNKL